MNRDRLILPESGSYAKMRPVTENSLRRISPSLVLLIVLLGTFVLRVFRLDVQSLWYDEAFSVYLAHFSVAEITARTAADIQPPLYYYLLHYWIALAGDSEFAVRFVSLLFGTLTIPLLYVAARRLFNSTVALTGALLAMLAPLYVWYSQEARMYTLITFLLLLSSYALLRALEPGNRRAWWAVFALANIAAAYTHYFAFVLIVFQVGWAIGMSLKVSAVQGFSRILKPLAIACAAMVIAFLPWAPFVVARFGQDASYWQGALKLDEAVRHIAISFTSGESVLEAQAQWIAVGWGAVLVAGLLALKAQSAKLRTQSVVFALLYLVVPLTLLLFLFYRNPKFNARYLMIASPGFMLLLAAGLASLWSLVRSSQWIVRGLASSFALLAFSFLLFTSAYADYNAYFDPAFTKASFREVASYIDSHIAAGEAIILTSGHLFPAFDYYYRGTAPEVRLPDDPTLNTDHVLNYDSANVLNRALAGARGVWVVLWQDEVVDPNGFVPMLLSQQGQEQKITGTDFYQVRLRHWTLNASAHFSTEPQPGTVRPANFQNKIELLGFDSPAPTPADAGASFNLYWHAVDTTTDDYQVALRVQDAAGNLWGKQDRRPAGYTYPTTRWKRDDNLFGSYTVPLLPGAPAGDYYVQVTLYTASNESGLDVLAPNGAPMGKTVKLGPIRVLPAAKPATYAALNIQQNVSQPLGPLTLLGYQLGRDKASAGESIPLTLFWRADSRPDKDYAFRLWFGSSPSAFLPLANQQFPTSQWKGGEVVRGLYNIQIPADATPGSQELKLDLNAGTDTGMGLALAPFTVEKTDRTYVMPEVQFAESANFGNMMALAGYDVETTAKPGGTVSLTLVWRARSPAKDKPYTVFVHLLDMANQVVAQKDAQPVNGTRPTTGWVENEFITDSYELALKPDLPPGTYQIEIGWYDATDFSRLPLLDENGVPGADRVILNTSLIVQ